MIENTLVIIPARGGSKSIPQKNIRLLGGKPLIQYTIEFAKANFPNDVICVTTDSTQIAEVVEQTTNLNVPFLRPAELATDASGSYEVLLHAVQYYRTRGIYFEKVLLLQPTSPFRKKMHLEGLISLFTEEVDMVVSVGESPHNPYFSLFEEDSNGYLQKSKKGTFATRQSCPKTYFYNGSMYLINEKSLLLSPLNRFKRIKKYVMDEIYSQDIDTPLDWIICETLLERGIITNAYN